jgi:hypothetical protein
VPPDGHVVGRFYKPDNSHYQPGNPGITTCNKYGCTTSGRTFGYWVSEPQSWNLTILSLHNPDWKGTVGVDPDVYNRCQMGDVWPDCSRPERAHP